jgi:hypothetical protein
MNNRVMYQVVTPGTFGFEADVLRFTDDLADAKKYAGEIWRITYVEWSWKRWKEEKIGLNICTQPES